MVQLVVDGIFLDLYEDDPLKLNIIFDDSDFGVVSDYSKSFRVPATKQNNLFFQQAFEINGIDFDVSVKREAQILVNGTEYKQGEIRLLKVYLSQDSKYADYEIFFLGEKKNLQTSIGEKTLCQLNLTGLTHTLDWSAITTSWEAYPSGTTTSGLFQGDVIYPLVDFGNSYTATTGPTQYLPEIPLAEQAVIGSYVNSGSVYSPQPYFTASTSPLEFERFKPMIRAKKIIDTIFEEAGFSYESTFFNSNFFRNLYVSAWGNEADFTAGINSNNMLLYSLEPQFTTLASSLVLFNVNQPVTFFPEFLPAPYDYNNNYNQSVGYTCPANGTYEGVVQMFVSNAFNNPIDIQFKLIRMTGTTEIVLASSGSLTSNPSNWFTTFSTTANTGDKLYIKVENNGTNPAEIYNSYFGITSSPGSISPGGYLSCDYKQIDFIKDILTKFRMVMIYQGNNRFLIEPWKDIIGSGEIYDWTELLDNSKDVVLEPTFYTQSKKVIFKDKSDTDIGNDWVLRTSNNGLPFGSRELVSNYELLTGEKVIETNFASTPIYNPHFFDRQAINLSNLRFNYTTIPLIWEGIVGEQHYQRVKEPMEPKTRLLFYNGMVNTSDRTGTTSFSTWYMRYTGSTTISYNQYPQVSSYSSFPVSASTDLNWYKRAVNTAAAIFEERPATQGGAPRVPRTDVYEVYWQLYMNTLYNKYSRRLTGYFLLDFDSVKSLTPRDVIFIKNSYWYIEKITELEVGRNEICKVDLIKLLDFSPDGSGYIPPTSNIWNLNSNLWNTESTTWN
jgi:hypothetical protein